MVEYTKEYRVLSQAFLYPQGWKLPFEDKICVLDKAKKVGQFLKGMTWRIDICI